MADEDDANNLGDDGDIDVGASKKGKASPITHLLKYVLIGIVAIIFIVTIVLITQSFTNSDESRAAPIASSEEYTITRETLDWYTSLDQVRTQTSDDIPASVNVTLALGYKKDDKQASTEITARRIEIIAFLRNFFARCTVEDLRPENELKLRMQIRDQINDDILSDAKIRDVQFTGFDVVKLQ